MSSAKWKTLKINMVNPATQELYLQLEEIRVQLMYLKETRLAVQVNNRQAELWDEFTAEEHKELAIALQNLGL